MTFEEYRDHHTCPHRTREMRKKPYQRQGKTLFLVKAQCLTCGDGVPSVIGKDRLATLPCYDEALESRWTSRFYEGWRAVLAQEREDQQRAWWDWYTAYLQTPTWHRKRQQVLRRAQGRCEGCGRHPAVQVHHLTYAHAGEEFLFELVAICQECHERVHAHKESAHA